MTQERRDYSQMSPQEINRELRGVLDILSFKEPTVLDSTLQDPEEQIAKLVIDIFATFGTTLMEFNRLISLSKLSEPLQKVLYIRILLISLETDEDRSSMQDLYRLVEAEPETGGVYDDLQARRIAGNIIRHYSNWALTTTVKNLGQEGRSTRGPLMELLMEARQEYLEKYGDEP